VDNEACREVKKIGFCAFGPVRERHQCLMSSLYTRHKHLYTGPLSTGVRYCRHFMKRSHVPDGYQGARGPAACAVFGGHRDFSASDVEVLTVV